ncbi:unnamed protein product [Rotaria sp. Silwood1]|nr:unnamed protein product [Rotaria sp. Silwood1]
MERIAMGSPLGPLFADIYINYLESKLKRRLKQNGVIYWRRFVDDSFVLVDENANINKLLDILNSFDTDIQFTVETEKNNSLLFLDILITRTANNLNNTGLIDLPVKALRSFLIQIQEYIPLIKVDHYEQFLNLLKKEYPRDKLNNQNLLRFLPILYPSSTDHIHINVVQLSDSTNSLTSIQPTDGRFKNNLKNWAIEISNLISEHESETEQHLCRCLIVYLDLQSIDQNNLEKICHIFDKAISDKSIKFSSEYFKSLCKLLKVNQVQELFLVLALQHSTHNESQILAREHI